MTEEERLRSLRDLVVLDSEPETLFDSIAQLASEICRAPIALMSLVDDQRQWFKANVGLAGVNETPRDVAFCAHAIDSDNLFEVPDATLDDRFAGNPLVVGAPDIRFYAGAPLSMPDGARVGTLCVIDREARRLDPSQASTLRALAHIASEALAMRRDLITKSLGVRTEFEARLATSEATHRALVESQSELVSLAKRDGTLVYVGPAYGRHFGLAPETMLGTNLFNYIDGPDRKHVKGVLARVFETGAPSENENRMVSADGAERWVAWRNGLHIDASGTPLLHSVGRDVTERRRVEAELRTSQSLLARTGKLSGVGGWELELSSGRLLWSEQTRRVHEVADDFIPTLESAIAFYPPESRALIEAAVKAGIEQGTPWDLELPIITATGRRIWARAMGELERENGLPVRLLGAFADITARKLLAQRLDESERFIRQITDHLPVRIAYVDPQMRYRFVNQAHCLLFGKRQEEIVGRTRDELTGRPYTAKGLAIVEAALNGLPQRFEYEEEIRGSIRLIESQLIPDMGSDGAVLGFYSTGVDITERAAAERELRDLTSILDNTPDFVVQTDYRGAVTYMNPSARAFCGLRGDEPTTGRHPFEFNSAQTNALFAQEILPAVKAKGVWAGEALLRRQDGGTLSVSHMVIGHRGLDGRVERYSAVMRDISQAAAGRQRLEAQTATLVAVMEAVPAIVAVVGPDLRVKVINRAYERFAGTERRIAIGGPLARGLGPRDSDGAQPWIERALAGETGSFERAIGGTTGARHVVGNYSPLMSAGGKSDGFILVAQDVTEHKREEVRLLQLALRDPLTGLLNRGGFEAEAERLVANGQGLRLAMLCVDLDHFKAVNDTHGHPTGDAVLRAFAERISRIVRPTDVVARLGGDEFAILLSGVGDATGARVVADKIVASAAAHFDVGSLQVAIGASVGVALDADAQGWQDLLARADAMLYKAKAAGRGRLAS